MFIKNLAAIVVTGLLEGGEKKGVDVLSRIRDMM